MSEIEITAHCGALEIRPASLLGFLKPHLQYWFRYTPDETYSYYDKGQGRMVQGVRRGRGIATTRVEMFRESGGALVVHEGMYSRVASEIVKAGHSLVYEKRDPQFREPFLDPSVIRGLHPDQADAVVSVLSTVAAPGVPGPSGAIVDATMGYGKTYVIAALCRAYRKKVVVTTKKAAVVKRLRDGLVDLLKDDGISVGLYKGSTRQSGDVIVCTNVLLDLFDDDDVDLLIYDECHHALGDVQSSLVMRLCRAIKVGLSGTLKKRFDGKDLLLEGLFGPIVHTVTDDEAEELGRVVPLEIHFLPQNEGPDISSVSSPVSKERRAIWANASRNRKARLVADRVPPDQQLLVFVRTLEHAKTMKGVLGEDYEIYHGGLSASESRRILEGFENGSIKRIVSTDSLGEGVDPKHLMVVIDMDWTPSDTKLAQRIGRNRRHAPGKTKGIVIGFEDRFDDLAHGKSLDRISVCRKRGYTVIRDATVEGIVFENTGSDGLSTS